MAIQRYGTTLLLDAESPPRVESPHIHETPRAGHTYATARFAFEPASGELGRKVATTGVTVFLPGRSRDDAGQLKPDYASPDSKRAAACW